MRFLVRIFRHKGDYSAMVPDLPGCVAAADTIEELRTLIAEGIRMHLDAMREKGERVPKPSKKFELQVDDLETDELCTWVSVKQKPHGRRSSKQQVA